MADAANNTRRSALKALALLGVSTPALAAEPAPPANEIDGLIALFKIASRQLDDTCDRACALLEGMTNDRVHIEVEFETGRVRRFFRESDVHEFYGTRLAYAPRIFQPIVDRLVKQLSDSRAAYNEEFRALGGLEIDAEINRLEAVREDLAQRLLNTKPQSLDQARSKIEALSRDIIGWISEGELVETKRVLKALV